MVQTRRKKSQKPPDFANNSPETHLEKSSPPTGDGIRSAAYHHDLRNPTTNQNMQADRATEVVWPAKSVGEAPENPKLPPPSPPAPSGVVSAADHHHWMRLSPVTSDRSFVSPSEYTMPPIKAGFPLENPKSDAAAPPSPAGVVSSHHGSQHARNVVYNEDLKRYVTSNTPNVLIFLSFASESPNPAPIGFPPEIQPPSTGVGRGVALEEYISLVVAATVKTGIERQMEAFRAGFNKGLTGDENQDL